MEDLLILLVTLLAFGLLGGGIAGWVAVARIGALRRSLDLLDRKVEFLLSRGAAGEGAEPDGMPGTMPDPALNPAPELAPIAVRAPQPTRSAPTPPRPEPRPSPRSQRTPAKPRPPLDLETLLGAKGSVWIGGLALLLGAVFLLRYTIEAGLLTPVMRLSLAAVLGGVALVASEVLARRDLKNPAARALAAKADIPALLAAVGVFALFGTVYAAHALYGLLATLPAFIGMAGVALGTMALSLRRGPWLAAIGLVGALAVPLLVASVTPSFVGVVAYVATIAAAAHGVAGQKGWSWLAAAALAGATAWLWVLTGKSTDTVQFGLWSAGLIGVAGLTLRSLGQAPIVTTAASGSEQPSGQPQLWMMMAWIGLLILATLGMAAGEDRVSLSYGLPFLLIGGAILAVWRGPARRFWGVLPMTGGVFAFLFAMFLYPDEGSAVPILATGYLVVAALFALATLHQSARIEGRQSSTALVIAGGVVAFVLLHYGLDGLDYDAPDTGRVLSLFSLSSLYLVAAAMRKRASVKRGALWTFATLWALSLGSFAQASDAPDAMAVYTGLALIGAIPVILLAARRDDLWARLSALSLPGLAGWIATEALRDSAAQISRAPLFNELWLFFGLPALICAAGAWWMERRRSDLASQGLQGGAVVFGLLLTVLLIHHGMNGGDLSARVGFESLAVQLLVAFAALLGGSWIKGGLTRLPDGPARSAPDLGPYILPALLIGLSLVSLGVFALFQLLGFNPLFNDATRIDGSPLFNALLLGYLLPALLLGAAALRYRTTRPPWFVRVLAALAALAWIAWTTAQIRVFAHGPRIDLGSVPWENVELYAVSAVWLLTGLALLGAGSVTKRRDLRLASALLITVTTLKVFLVDMSELEGALRALSFIGLGIVLIGIGRFYQRVLTTTVKFEGQKEGVS